MYKSDVVQYFGTQLAIASLLGFSPSAISQWPEIIPERSAARLAHLTAGRKRNGIKLKVDYSLYNSSEAA